MNRGPLRVCSVLVSVFCIAKVKEEVLCVGSPSVATVALKIISLLPGSTWIDQNVVQVSPAGAGCNRYVRGRLEALTARLIVLAH